MRLLRSGVWFALVLMWPAAAQASLIAKLLYRLHSATAPKYVQKAKLTGQETQSFKLHKAQASDILAPLQHYLDGIDKAGGAVQVRESDNALIVTAFPEDLLRVGALIPDIDHVYDNANAQAREMLVTQSLMKAIRNHGGMAVASRNIDHPAPRAKNGLASAPVAPSTPGAMPSVPSHSRSRDEEDMAPNPVHRWARSPTLSQFEVVGWLQDSRGYTVVLNNQGQRFLYHQGRLHGGYDPRSEPIQGISGSIRNHQLILNDRQGSVSLNMLKWRTL